MGSAGLTPGSSRFDWPAALCVAAVAACAFLPFGNPDLFWHLSAAERILESGAIPRADWLSWTRPGAPWVDFEWLSQLLWLGAKSNCGWWGLMGVKVALFAAAGAALWRTLGLYRLSSAAKGGWLLAWALAALPANDLRPEAFSLALFGLLWWWIERERLGPAAKPRTGELGAAAAVFAIWANLHAGFAYGLLLLILACVAAEPRRRGRLAGLAVAGAAGTLLNPWGFGLHPVLIEHATAAAELASLIQEWGPPTLRNPWLWPFWGLLFTAFGVILERQWKGRLPLLHALALCLFGLSAGRLVRTVPYFAAVAAPIAAAAFASIGSRRLAWAGRAAAGLLLLYSAARVAPELTASPLASRYTPEGAAAFLEAQAAALAGKPMVHPVEWGGFLAWRLGPRFPVFADGRYLFHDLVKASHEARLAPESFHVFLDAYRADVVLLARDAQRVETVANVEKNRKLVLSRPAWLFFVPKATWALVYWDAQALVLARRASVPAAWLDEHEYTLHRPGDETGAAMMVREGYANGAILTSERARHSAR